TIPSSCTYYPVLTSSLGVGTSSYTYDCASLTINSGGSVTGTNTNFYTWLYGTLDINSGGTFHQNFNTSGRMEIRSGGKLQVDGGTCYIGSNSGYGYSDIYLRTGGEVEVNSGTLRIDDRLYVESGATVDLNGGNTYVKYRGRGDGDHGFRLRSGATLTMDGSPNLYICGAYSTSTSYCGLYFHTSSNVTCNGGFIRFLNGTGYTHSFYVNFGGKTARYVYNDKSTNYVYTCGNMNCYQLRANQGRFYVRNAVYASNNVYTYNAGRIYLDNASSSLSGYSYDLNNTGGLYVSNGTCTCRYRFYKYNGAYAQFSGGTTNIAREYYNYGTLGNTTVNGGTLNFGTAGNYYSYNYNGKFYVTSGTVDLDYVWKQENGFTSNLTQIDGGTVSVQHLQNYDGVISHSGGTLNISQYYRENDAGGGIYYGRLTAVMNLTGSSYLRLTRAGSYFNHVNVNGTYYIETGSTQNFDINGNFTINLGKSFDTNGRTMYVAKNWTNSGTFTHDNNIVRFDGSTNSTISGPTIFYELEVNKTNNTYWVKPAASTELHITNLDVSHLGTFDATNTGLNIRTP
ncbi:hypothetical protein KAH81_00580, partial [bacterium]|nr:hypothetical protein [bacterium]